jgi:hypothetical protein
MYSTPVIHRLSKAFFDRMTDGGKAWKWTGWELMQEIEAFAKKHPDIVISGVDDDSHSSSDIVFIPHRDKHYCWGITVVYVPQSASGLSGLATSPAVFFLYPGHLKALLATLNGLAKMIRSYGDRKLEGIHRSSFDRFKPVPWSKAKRWKVA